jgi:hypothetical protein
LEGREDRPGEGGQDEWFVTRVSRDACVARALLTVTTFVSSLSDQQIAQLYELMQAIKNRSEDGGEGAEGEGVA